MIKVRKYWIWLLPILIILGWYGIPLFYSPPSFNAVKSKWRSSEATLLDRNGQVIHELRIDKKVRRLYWSSLNDISPAFQQAAIQSEDRRFYKHSGVDWRAIGAAIWSNVQGDKRGGSTITMQLTALLDPRLAVKSNGRSLSQKWTQIWEAKAIERNWTKAEILEAYFNLVSFRGEGQGITIATQWLFKKSPSGLNNDESILLAALIPSPNAKPLRVAKRACNIGMVEPDKCQSLTQLALQSLEQPTQFTSNIALAPHLARQLLKTSGEQVKSTLDSNLQIFADRTLRSQLTNLANEKVNDGAVIVLDNKSGDVLAYVGNSGNTASAQYVDGVRSLRQAGSTLKPFLYALAIENQLLTAASVLEDSPVNISTQAGLYVPQNYDRDFKGPVSVRTALASSLNVPAIRTLVMMGMEPFYQLLRKLGYQSINQSAEYYGYSLALGSAEVSLLQQVNAYRALANKGQWSAVRFIKDDKKNSSIQIINPSAAFIISDILADPSARSVTFGLDNTLATSYWSAVKTGTSKDMRDNWAIGFSDRYTIGVWVGNFDGESMRNVSGVTGAAPIWREIMDYLRRDNPISSPAPPPGVISQKVEFTAGIEPSRKEWFIENTQIAVMKPSLQQKKSTPHISYPNKDTLIALDPDIPQGKQVIFFEAQPSLDHLQWKLNGKELNASKYVKWQPKVGMHRLTLLDSSGQTLDEIQFQVRGVSK